MNTLFLISIIFFFFFFFYFFFHSIIILTSAMEPPCKKSCGSIEIKYPLGSGQGCGSPRFHPYVGCSAATNQLLLTTHTGTYPITSVDYSAALITIAPPCMSNCTNMQPTSITFGLDWAGPFQLGPSTFILLGCSTSTSSIAIKGNLICDAASSAYLCASIYSCPAVVALGLPLFPATNSCCVYSPANLDPRDELNVGELQCAAYSSVAALGDVPTDPARWHYGVALKYTLGGLDGYNKAPTCRGCELSGGVCGYAPPRNAFVCVCDYANTTTDCTSYNWIYMSPSNLQLRGQFWLGIILGMAVWLMVI